MQKISQGSRRQERGKKEDMGTIEKMDSRVRNYPWSLAFLWKTQVWKSVLCDAVNLKNTVHYLSSFSNSNPTASYSSTHWSCSSDSELQGS